MVEFNQSLGIRSLGQEGLPGVVEALELVALDGAIPILIALRVCDFEDGEELACRNGADLDH